VKVLAAAGRPVLPLALVLHNEIPLGMGMGSSAAALLAGVLLANHFGELWMDRQQILEEACRREGHPDNVAACWLGGMTSSASVENHVVTATCGENIKLELLIALPSGSLATEKARALLPDVYPRADAVANVQSTALLVRGLRARAGRSAAICDARPVPSALPDEACPLLPRLLPMTGEDGVLGVALSGAGPSVLLIAEQDAPIAEMVGKNS